MSEFSRKELYLLFPKVIGFLAFVTFHRLPTQDAVFILCVGYIFQQPVYALVSLLYGAKFAVFQFFNTRFAHLFDG